MRDKGWLLDHAEYVLALEVPNGSPPFMTVPLKVRDVLGAHIWLGAHNSLRASARFGMPSYLDLYGAYTKI